MSALEDVQTILTTNLPAFPDEDLFGYIVSVVEAMTLEERRSKDTLIEAIMPFLLDTGYIDDEEEGTKKCQAISVSFGGSGYKSASSSAATAKAADEDVVQLLAAPVKIKEGIKEEKRTYGAVIFADTTDSMGGLGPAIGASTTANAALDISAVATTAKQLRKLRKDNEQLQRILRLEAAQREQEEEEMRRARMAAIKAARNLGRQD
jgi:hypothetical protein